jgi:cytochrome P450
MMHNEDTFPQPEEFRPERFMEPSTVSEENDPTSIVFGYGRR